MSSAGVLSDAEVGLGVELESRGSESAFVPLSRPRWAQLTLGMVVVVAPKAGETMRTLAQRGGAGKQVSSAVTTQRESKKTHQRCGRKEGGQPTARRRRGSRNARPR
jgi:hypothetical protein